MNKSFNIIQEKLLDKRELFLFGDVETKPVLKIIRGIHYLNHENNNPILLYINSNGGDPEDGQAVIDEISESTSEIWTIVQGKAYSAAADILLSGHQRFATKNSSIMFHEYSLSYESVPRTEHISYTKYVEFMFDKMIKTLSKITEMSEEDTREFINNGEYLMANKAKKLNIIHDIWSPTKYLT